MNNQSRLPNPFHLEGDPINGRLFVGRQSIFDWLSENQNNQDGTRILLLMGEPQIGKTSLLQQLRNSQDSAEHKSIYVNCHTLNSTSISQFLFSFTKSILEALNFINLPAFSNLRQADFVAKPFKKLGETLREIENHVDTAKLIYLIDNFDGAWSELADTDRPESIIAKLNKQLNTTQFSQFILTTLINPIWYSDEFESFKVEEIPSLSPSETAQLFRLAMRATIVDDVAKYIHALTDGKPILLHKIGHALFEWQQSANIQQLTRSDVAKAALDIDLVKPTELSNFQPSPVITKVGRFRPFSPIQMAGLALGLLLIPLWMLFSFGPADAQIEETSISFANQPTETENLANLAIEPTIELENISTSQTETPEPLQDPSPTVEPTLTNTPTSTPTATQTATPTPTPTSTVTPLFYPNSIVRENDNMPMILIPSGTFLMGSIEGEFLSNFDEYPQREVTMGQFYIDQFEVSVEQYASFLNRIGTYDNGCDFFDCALPRELAGYTAYLTEQDLGDGTLQYLALSGFASYPMNHVSWYGASTYCQAMGARLPTEAEWEYAARGVDGRLYPWGNETPNEELATFNSSSYDNLKPVDALPDGASPFGIFNMAGSLWEWTADWYDETYYQSAPNENPLGPETGLTKVMRGGGWPFNNQAERLRTANRNSLTPDFLSSTVGFRCARTP